ncbi:carboxylate--amine ligase [Pseudonocardia sp. EC080610-09]|uniref:carboxylate--amine ligase/circularly permuted type 2 ATP-grasp protein n=1 Tax=unclassified Pseudonocardia TaxID=2619320 RepID=UPI0006CB0CE9|nr:MULTISPECIES: carboxylate--amine ligase/circularly permuted type 2 ATP-grasp protein [unclassified Pseudonocardia]ALE72548.1 carboxylate--amine ligase [Pseudonocardia sp. EC080625-04]ALL75863.1 carboxylate--amine ligase [Pseudonocardia sp. EC080610-09]ALL82890.1 carboxylate--amine ligase [Pseudonocardia sp. EC080619-01]
MGDVSLVGVEEEFHVVGLTDRRAAPDADRLLEHLDGAEFFPELQRSLVETNTPATESLDDLRRHVRRLRARLREAAEPLGLGVVAAGTVPLVDLSGDDVSAGARYERMQHEYQMLVREQHICGLQVHADVPDRDTAVQVSRRVAPALPALLAITASSPYWRGHDTGYASYRSMIWQRWPTAGPPGDVTTAAEYDAMIDELITSGTISDAGMLYFDVRPSAHLPTVELRVCDACPEVDDVVLVAGLFRALVARARADTEAGRPLPRVRHELLRAAGWRAARSGLEGDLVDVSEPAAPVLSPPAVQLRTLVAELRPWLEDTGDAEQVEELAEAVLARGSGAAAQRRAFGHRGSLVDVVDDLLARTQGEEVPGTLPVTVPVAPDLLSGYVPPRHDEAVDDDLTIRPAYGWLFRSLERLGTRGLTAAESALRTEQRARGVTFPVPGVVPGDDGERLFPLDLVPRIVAADDWAHLSAGLAQRVRALEHFVRDVYGRREIVRDRIVPAAVVDGAPGRTRSGTLVPPDAVRIAVAGIDLVRDSDDGWVVLEDNLRVPSGIGFSMMSRRLIRSVLPDLESPSEVLGLDDVPARLRTALVDDPSDPDGETALLTAGESDPAFFEHRLLAEALEIPLVTPSRLQVTDGAVFLVGGGRRRRLTTLYRRMDETGLATARGADHRPIGRALLASMARGRTTLRNAPGNGVADDKLVYAYVPAMIRYYLGEEPVLASVPTLPCADPVARDEVLDRLGELVLKPVDGYGGAGIVIGPHATPDELDRVAAGIRAHPASWVAQDMVRISTHPTFTDGLLQPQAVDLRVFAVQSSGRGATPEIDVLPSALSRVAPPGGMIVNSSRGGGAKDTWIMA